MGKKWVVKAEPDNELVQALQNDLHLNPHIAKLLVQRNLKTKHQVERFFNPSLTHLYDPFLMKDMDKAIVRIKKAIERREKILIYGD
ncbi:MAG: single-stranded-DNA-specific exonuclease RecJ, partial [Bacteroidales bacterium]